MRSKPLLSLVRSQRILCAALLASGVFYHFFFLRTFSHWWFDDDSPLFAFGKTIRNPLRFFIDRVVIAQFGRAFVPMQTLSIWFDDTLAYRSARFAHLHLIVVAPWVYQFRINGADYGGAISAVEDERLAQFFAFAPNPVRVLELGALEGAQTVPLAARVPEVAAIEGRAANLRKAQLVKNSLGIRNVQFLQANLEETDLTAYGRFDAVFSSGLLYHLPEPWKLIEQLPRVAPKLFLWTHYADDLAADVTRHGLRGQIHPEGGQREPLSGLSDTAFWPTLGSLIKLLSASGYHSIEILKNDVKHQNVAAATMAAGAQP